MHVQHHAPTLTHQENPHQSHNHTDLEGSLLMDKCEAATGMGASF